MCAFALLGDVQRRKVVTRSDVSPTSSSSSGSHPIPSARALALICREVAGRVTPRRSGVVRRVAAWLQRGNATHAEPPTLIKRESAWCVINRDGAPDDLPSIPVRFSCNAPPRPFLSPLPSPSVRFSRPPFSPSSSFISIPDKCPFNCGELASHDTS